MGGAEDNAKLRKHAHNNIFRIPIWGYVRGVLNQGDNSKFNTEVNKISRISALSYYQTKYTLNKTYGLEI